MKTSITTGIPRVVCNLVKHGWEPCQRHGVDLIPIRFDGEFFVPAPLSNSGELLVPRRQVVKGTLGRLQYRFKKIFFGRTVRDRYQKLKRLLSQKKSTETRFRFQSNDILLLPDSSWAEPMWKEVDAAIANGVLLGILQHDFIPVRYPQLVSAESTATFTRWMTETLSRADFVFGVSETIAQECREELRKLGRNVIADSRVGVCHNGADFEAVGASSQVRPQIMDFLSPSKEPPYLTVGTVEPRKNQCLLADAFDPILDAVPHARFLIAGVIGWHGHAIAEKIRKHRSYGTNILLATDMTDTELAYAYHHAKAVVFPSLAEGFGLPIVESIARGTRVFASNIPVHREIGGKYCVYFDPNDAQTLARMLIDYSMNGQFPAEWPPVGFRIPSWQDAAETMVATALATQRIVRTPESAFTRVEIC
jgi:alpha-1,2-rhamnosyltransferase